MLLIISSMIASILLLFSMTIVSSTPLASFNEIPGLCAIHFSPRNVEHQETAAHYCTEVNIRNTSTAHSKSSGTLFQCALFDSPEENAKLIGIEYIIPENMFVSLSATEKQLWHSHTYEVKSGQLGTIGANQTVENELMKKLVSTYGKIFHLWQVQHDPIPIGIPELMMALTADGQARPELLKNEDHIVGSTLQERKKRREDIPVPKKVEGADNWMTTGKAPYLVLKQQDMNKSQFGDVKIGGRDRSKANP